MISRAAHLAVRGDVEAAVISSAICSSRGFTLQVLGGGFKYYIYCLFVQVGWLKKCSYIGGWST